MAINPEIFICLKCGQVSRCELMSILHVRTSHLYEDVYVSKELEDERGVNCLGCLLTNTMEISQYYHLKKEGKL